MFHKINQSHSSPYFDILESLSFQVRHVVLLVALRVVALVESEGSECGVVEELVEAGQGVELSLHRHNANQLLHFFHQIRCHRHLKTISSIEFRLVALLTYSFIFSIILFRKVWEKIGRTIQRFRILTFLPDRRNQ